VGGAWERAAVLRYGENPHQPAALYLSAHHPGGLAAAEQLHGKEMSYNNYVDADAAYRAAYDFAEPAVAIIKHANPCGIAVGADIAQAHARAHETDPVSAFGGVIAANRQVDAAFAEAVVEQFAEVVIAPSYLPEALEVLASKKNLRVLEAGPALTAGVVVRDVDGGFLLQDRDVGWGGEVRETATGRGPTEAELAAMELAWRVVKHVSSNAIVVGAADRILGIGAGQMSRVDAAKIAVAKAAEHGHDLTGAVAASDAFFPFPDGVEALHEAGIRAVIQPGGSIKDAEVVAACDRLGMAMVMTRRRHFRH
jgi:phosphoribosylaminoimidazolecarboxamide formyltransferase/IMP cyclohydrolase